MAIVKEASFVAATPKVVNALKKITNNNNVIDKTDSLSPYKKGRTSLDATGKGDGGTVNVVRW